MYAIREGMHWSPLSIMQSGVRLDGPAHSCMMESSPTFKRFYKRRGPHICDIDASTLIA